MNEKKIPDSELVKALQKGKVKAFDKLFDKYGVKILFLAKGYLGSHEDAEGIVQEVFIKIWENREKIKEHLSFRSYLFTITYNSIRKAFNLKYKEKNFLNEFMDNHSDKEVSSNIKVEYNELLDEVNKVVESLSARQKEIYILSREKGLTHKEIAKLLSISPKTVENHIHEAIKHIKNHLKRMGLLGMIFFILFFS